MPTDENLTNTNPTPNNESWVDSTNINTNPENEEKLDFLDIDLNLDGLDIPNEKWDNPNSENEKLEEVTKEIQEDNTPKVEETDSLTDVEVVEKIENEEKEQDEESFEQENFQELEKLNELNLWNQEENSIQTIDLNENKEVESKDDIEEQQENNIDNQTNESKENRLAEENKKFEESIGLDNNVENKQEEKELDINEKVSNEQNLDLPFLENENTNQNVEEWIKLDDLNELFPENKENLTTESQISTNDKEISQNINGNTVQKDTYISSDTWDDLSQNTWYIPNKEEFSQVQDLLNSNQTGTIDLSVLEQNTNPEQPNWLNKEQNEVENNKQNSWINLNELMSEPTAPISNEGINIDQIIQSSQFEPIIVNNNNSWEQNQQTQTVTQVPEWAKVVSSNELKKKTKKKWSGIKVFILIVLLIIWWYMILSKMYPEEIWQIISVIKNGNEVDLESEETGESIDETNDESEEDLLINNLSGDDLLNENVLTWDILTWDVLTWDTMNENQTEEEIDPNSLAWQLEIENVIDTNNEVAEVNTEANTGNSIEWNHGSADDEFNAFEEIDNMIESETSPNQKAIEQLQEYAQLWNSFNIWWRENNNSTAMKYWLFIKNHSERLINNIETDQEINMIEVEDYISKFDNYIEKLNALTWL
jgi:hypothetical protein